MDFDEKLEILNTLDKHDQMLLIIFLLKDLINRDQGSAYFDNLIEDYLKLHKKYIK